MPHIRHQPAKGLPTCFFPTLLPLGWRDEPSLLAAARSAAAAPTTHDRGGRQIIEDVRRLSPLLPVDASHPLLILYTSGSTGKAKGIVHAHAGYLVGLCSTARVVFALDAAVAFPIQRLLRGLVIYNLQPVAVIATLRLLRSRYPHVLSLTIYTIQAGVHFLVF